jgi:hypothetical protein
MGHARLIHKAALTLSEQGVEYPGVTCRLDSFPRFDYRVVKVGFPFSERQDSQKPIVLPDDWDTFSLGDSEVSDTLTMEVTSSGEILFHTVYYNGSDGHAETTIDELNGIIEGVKHLVFVCIDVDKEGKEIPGTGCGVIPHIEIDGYNFGDRMLETVMFEVSVTDCGSLVIDAKGGWDNNAYLMGLNKAHWLRRGLEYARDEKGCDIAACPMCGGDVDGQARLLTTEEIESLKTSPQSA